VAEKAAQLWAHEALVSTSIRGVFRVALSGGKTPEPLFRLLTEDRFNSLPWEKTEVYWTDERYVPHGHAESNYRLAREALLDDVPVPKEHVHPMPTDSGDPEHDAAAYEDLLRQTFRNEAAPRFDLVLLGLGDDGHTASLFPGDAAVADTQCWVRASRSPKGVRDRITLTVPVLNRAALKIFLVCGEGKAAILRKILFEPALRPPLPAQLIEEPVCLADRAATPWLGKRS
jgi:6-phosphogluconolactonase